MKLLNNIQDRFSFIYETRGYSLIDFFKGNGKAIAAESVVGFRKIDSDSITYGSLFFLEHGTVSRARSQSEGEIAAVKPFKVPYIDNHPVLFTLRYLLFKSYSLKTVILIMLVTQFTSKEIGQWALPILILIFPLIYYFYGKKFCFFSFELFLLRLEVTLFSAVLIFGALTGRYSCCGIPGVF